MSYRHFNASLQPMPLSRTAYCFYAPRPVPYLLAWQWQQALADCRRDNCAIEDVLVLLEHPPVYTLGRGASLDFLKFDRDRDGRELHRVDRGGEVTYHCPGQLVGYPILNLRRHRQDLHWYLRALEEVLIQVLASYGLKGAREPGLTGVWLHGVKVAAIGIKASRWITTHGFALNVCPDLTGFEAIVPCGIADRAVGSLAQFLPGITVDAVRPVVADAFARVFDLEWLETPVRPWGEAWANQESRLWNLAASPQVQHR